ncbi:MAG: hypothetical protein GY798_15495 [Hyphomicrobiales bacterium]|nr:hypothetical protein [Hyphomicrobiales bacterium]
MAIADGGGHGGSSHGTTASDLTPRVQITRSGTVETKYPPRLATQLFSAEGEIYWLGDAGWDPAILRGDGFSRSDVFALADNTFITVAFDAEKGIARYARVQAGKSAGLIDIKVRAHGTGSIAEVTYAMTSLSEEGDAALSAITEEAFAIQMAEWQTAIEASDDEIHDWLASRN